ncbi:MAG: hypothetical protein UV60_C0001G0018 [Parcubacteria group bacterium GW2011_GWA2_43_11]|nr:MAG: hypothetical protein UV60_C0001G0018 [Parcubacteria group bacterium GW2011_GWA2_43_11]
MVSSFRFQRISLKNFVVRPVSKDCEVFVGCLCPTCDDVYVLGYYYVDDAGVQNGPAYYVSDETVTCINCGESNLQRPLVFLTTEEASNYVTEHDSETFFKVTGNQCKLWRMNAQMYLYSQREHTIQ